MELLIVLAILAVLAAVVIPNVTGMFGRGAKQSFATDQKTIQTGVAAFYFDIYLYDVAGKLWLPAGTTAGHYYPTASSVVSPLTLDTAGTLKGVTGFKETTFLVKGAVAGVLPILK